MCFLAVALGARASVAHRLWMVDAVALGDPRPAVVSAVVGRAYLPCRGCSSTFLWLAWFLLIVVPVWEILIGFRADVRLGSL